MKINNVLEELCQTCDNGSCPHRHYDKDRCAKYKSIKNQLDLLERFTVPKKLDIRRDTDGRTIMTCPNCGKILVVFFNPAETIRPDNHCNRCGQRLAWGDTDGD